MKQLVLLAVTVFLSGCMQMPWQVKETRSTFDGSTTISVGPGGMSDSLIGFRLYRNTKMKAGEIILVAAIGGAKLFGEEPSLLFKIDGEIVSLSSFDGHARIKTDLGFSGSGLYVPPSNSSSKRYEVDRNFIHRLVTAQKVLVKLNLRDSYAEGDFNTGGGVGAKAGFINFLAKMP